MRLRRCRTESVGCFSDLYQSSRRPWPIVHARKRASSMWPRTRATTALHRMMSTVTASSALRILNLDRATATPEKLKSSFKELAKKWHPDRHQGKGNKESAEAKFKELQAAYQMLSEPGALHRAVRGESASSSGAAAAGATYSGRRRGAAYQECASCVSTLQSLCRRIRLALLAIPCLRTQWSPCVSCLSSTAGDTASPKSAKACGASASVRRADPGTTRTQATWASTARRATNTGTRTRRRRPRPRIVHACTAVGQGFSSSPSV